MFKMKNGDRVRLSEQEASDFEESRTVSLEEKRFSTTLAVDDFCINAHAAGLLTDAELEEAATGVLPASFSAAISGLTVQERARIRSDWSRMTRIRRDSKALAFFAQSLNVSATQLDAIFGIG